MNLAVPKEEVRQQDRSNRYLGLVWLSPEVPALCLVFVNKTTSLAVKTTFNLSCTNSCAAYKVGLELCRPSRVGGIYLWDGGCTSYYLLEETDYKVHI